MRIAAVAFLLGVGVLQLFSQLPAWPWSLFLFLLLPSLYICWQRHWLWRASCFVLLGFLWASAMGHWLLRHDLPANLEG